MAIERTGPSNTKAATGPTVPMSAYLTLLGKLHGEDLPVAASEPGIILTNSADPKYLSRIKQLAAEEDVSIQIRPSRDLIAGYGKAFLLKLEEEHPGLKFAVSTFGTGADASLGLGIVRPKGWTDDDIERAITPVRTSAEKLVSVKVPEELHFDVIVCEHAM
jgi:hypothetical protein